MNTKEELIKTYEQYSDDKLLTLNSNISQYSDISKEALAEVILQKGGLELMIQHQNERKIINREIDRVQFEAAKLANKHTSVDFIKNLVKSDILPEEKVTKIIEIVVDDFEKQAKDKEINLRTISGSLFGFVVSSVVGGLIWGLQMITLNRMILAFIIIVGIINYGIIKLLTKQSKQNIVVAITVILSIILSIILGIAMFSLFGYQGARFGF